MRRAVAKQAATIVRHGGEGGCAVPALCPIDELECTLCDGSSYQLTPPSTGFAGATQGRGKMRSKSARQLEYCLLVGHTIGSTPGYEGLRWQEASQLMLEWVDAVLRAALLESAGGRRRA